MDKNSVSSIPVIDLQQLADSKDELKKLREASEKWGCFRIINHPIPLTLMGEMKTVVRSLLDLPTEIKRRNTDVINGSGYWAPTTTNPLYEALGLYDIASSQAVLDFCSQLDASTDQRKVIKEYSKAIHELALDLAKKMVESLGLEGVDFKEWPCQFRINKYNFSPESVGSTGVQIHTDSGFLTILQDDENVGGLEVMDSSGSFVEVPTWAATLVVNLGDVAHAWTNGRFCNPKHRVQCKESSVRISIATFFLGPPKHTNVEAPEELVDSDHPRLYLPFTYEDYRNLRFSSKMQAGEALQLLRSP